MAQPYVGEIRMFGGSFAPAGWMLCDGQTLPISENETLFQLIGTTYGGDGESTFQLPNLQSRVPIHMGSNAGQTFVLADAAGVESVTLTVQQLPIHNHTFNVTQAAGTDSDPTGRVIGQHPTASMFSVAPPAGAMNAQVLAPIGGSQPHENLQPYLCINFIISLFGIFPSPT